jgi:alkanesulfonate monooxygenase SsuD/methylene tetrahydromethanopterin reductase-like flavin-dependent oxidoreductase (luciferase family)
MTKANMGTAQAHGCSFGAHAVALGSNRRTDTPCFHCGWVGSARATVPGMRFVLMTEPQLGGSYDDLLFACRATEQAGLEYFARSDHYYLPKKEGVETTEAFTTLGGLARETGNVRLVVLVTPITFRHPAVIAKSASTLDQMTGGRFDLGVGTGWMEREHHAFGVPFPPRKERFERLEESLGYLRATFSGQPFGGRYYSTYADAKPRPTGVRIVVGGSGPDRTPTLAGRFADEYNTSVIAAEDLTPRIAKVRATAEAHGRDPNLVTISVMGPAVLAASEKRFDKLLAAGAAFQNVTREELLDRWRKTGVPLGKLDDSAPAIARLQDLGVEKYYMQWLDLADRSGIEEMVSLAATLEKSGATSSTPAASSRAQPP